MNETNRFFEKANIIFNLLKDGDEVPIDKIKQELNVSSNIVTAALKEFNLFERTIQHVGHDKVKFIERKTALTDCPTYNLYYSLLEKFRLNPEHYMYGNEVEVAKELGLDRKVIQKIKAIIRMK